jgi:hypothetical protein
MTGYQTQIDEAAKVLTEIETYLRRQLRDWESERLDFLTDKLQLFLDACVGDPMLEADAEELLKRIRTALKF